LQEHSYSLGENVKTGTYLLQVDAGAVLAVKKIQVQK
jgi:hypothetical protein